MGLQHIAKINFAATAVLLYYLQQKELLPIKLPLHDKNETTIMDNYAFTAGNDTATDDYAFATDDVTTDSRVFDDS